VNTVQKQKGPKKKDRPCKRGTAATVKTKKVLFELMLYFDD
jgi:hypothetical protein